MIRVNSVSKDLREARTNLVKPNDLKDYLNMPETVIRNGKAVNIADYNKSLTQR